MLVFVDGNVACGKSTLIRSLNTHYGDEILVLAEPIHLWRNVKGENLLARMYENPKKNGFAFQSYVLYTQMKRLEEAVCSDKKIVVLERSLEVTISVFVQNLVERGYMSGAERFILQELGNHFLQHFERLNEQKPLLIVYIEMSSSLCAKNLKHRNRREERGVTEGYLQDLERLHGQWIKGIKDRSDLWFQPEVVTIKDTHVDDIFAATVQAIDERVYS